MLEHAPVTGLTLIVGVFSSALTMDRYLRPLSHATASIASGVAATAATTAAAAAAATTASTHSSTLLGSLLRLSLESIPFGPHGTSLLDMALTGSIVYQMRVLERRWGSSAFLAFLLAAAGVGIGVMHMLVTESTTPALSVDALRVVSAGASLVPLVALVTRYVAEVPNVHTTALPIPLTRLRITEKALVLLPLLKLVVAPNHELQASDFKRRAIHVDIGGWNRLLLALVGILFAVFATKSMVLRCGLRAVSRYACRPLLLFLDPVLNVLFATRSHVQHILPKRLAQAQEAAQRARDTGTAAAAAQRLRHYNARHVGDDGGDGVRHSSHHYHTRHDGGAAGDDVLAQHLRQAHMYDTPPIIADGGRYMVDSLAGPALTAPLLRRRAAAAPPGGDHVDEHGGSNSNNNSTQSGAEGGGSSSDVAMEAAIAQIEELGLGLARAQIAHALTATHGDVNAAVHLLMDA